MEDGADPERGRPRVPGLVTPGPDHGRTKVVRLASDVSIPVRDW